MTPMNPRRSPHRAGPSGRLLAAATLAIGALSHAAPASAHAALRVDLHPTAEVGAMHVTLGDLATVTGDDAERVARVAALEVGDVASDGAASLVDRGALSRWVRTHAGVAPQDIAWGGAERCRVHRVADAAPVRPGGVGPDADVARARAPGGGGARALVVRGATATLRSVDGAIELESRVEVREDGAAGQDVRVRLPGATADVLARVTGPGRVEVLR